MPRPLRAGREEPQLLSQTDALSLAGISHDFWTELASIPEYAEKLPRPVMLPGHTKRYRRSDILKWIAELPTRQ